MKEQNLILLIALVVANLMSDRIKPLVDNVLGKLVLVLTICYLANKHIILGLLGVLLYTSIYNGLLEGMAGQEGSKEDEVLEEPDEDTFTGREGSGGSANQGDEIEEEPEEEEEPETFAGREGNDCPEDDQECGGR